MAIHHLGGNFQFTVGRLAMQHMTDTGVIQQRLIDLVRHDLSLPLPSAYLSPIETRIVCIGDIKTANIIYSYRLPPV